MDLQSVSQPRRLGSTELVKLCTHCHKLEDLPQFRLQICARCYGAAYCSKDCQRADWPRHKTSCAFSRSNRDAMKTSQKQKKSEAEARVRELGFKPTPGGAKRIGAAFSGWLKVHNAILRDSAIHALTLQKTPDRIFTDIVIIGVAPNFVPLVSEPPDDVGRAFFIVDVMVGPLTTMIPEWLPDENGSTAKTESMFEHILGRSRAVRERGGMGGIILGVVPLTPSNPAQFKGIGLDTWVDESILPYDQHWEAHLKDKLGFYNFAAECNYPLLASVINP